MWGDHDAAAGAAGRAGIDEEGSRFRSSGRNDHGGRHSSQMLLGFPSVMPFSSRFRHKMSRALVSRSRPEEKKKKDEMRSVPAAHPSSWACRRVGEADASALAGWFKGMSRVLVERSTGADTNFIRETGRDAL